MPPHREILGSHPTKQATHIPILCKEVVVIGAGIGAGHNCAAQELCLRLSDRNIRVHQYDLLDALPWAIRSSLRSGYAPLVNHLPSLFNFIIKRSGSNRFSHEITALTSKLSRKMVLEWVGNAAVIVATHAFATQALGDLKSKGQLCMPIASYLCDAGTHPLLFHEKIEKNLVAIAQTKMECARLGHPAEVVGPLVRQEFSQAVPEQNRLRLREAFHVPVDRKFILVCAGSLGLGRVSQIVRDVLAEVTLVSVIVLCGHNRGLQKRLSRIPGVIVIGWRQDIPSFLAIADLVVHNAGGMAIWEAVVANVPILTYLPLAGHGQENARILELAGISPWPRSRFELGQRIREQLQVRGQRRDLPEHDAVDSILSLI